MLRMDRQGFQRFLNQIAGGNRFSRTAVLPAPTGLSGCMPSEGMREAILNFAKRYGIFRRSSTWQRNMTLRLKQMADYLPKSWRGQLMEA